MLIGFTYFKRGKLLNNLIYRVTIRRRVLSIAKASGVDGFTLLSGIGAWQGLTEPTLQLQIEGISTRKGERLARNLKRAFDQDSVMVKTGRSVRFL